MATRTREDRRLRLLSAVCLALPEAERTLCGAHADFRVHGKIFAYYLKNHGGDGIVAACVKARLGEHVQHVERAPNRFYLPQFIGFVTQDQPKSLVDFFEKPFILIDEPELHLHPAGHARLFGALLALGKQNQVIAATTSAEILKTVPADHVIDLSKGWARP